MNKSDQRELSLFLLKGGISVFGILFVAYQFSFTNFSKVELDAVKLKAEVELARGVTYDDFESMKCEVKPKTPQSKTKAPEINSKAPTDSKTPTTDGKSKESGSEVKNQEVEKPDPTNYIEYTKCVLAKKAKEQSSSIFNMTAEFGELIILLSPLMLVIGGLLYSNSAQDEQSSNAGKPEESKQGNKDTSGTPSQQNDEGNAVSLQPEEPKVSSEGTGTEEEDK